MLPPPPARAPISPFLDELTEGLMEGGHGPGTNLALQPPAPAPRPRWGRRSEGYSGSSLPRALCEPGLQLSPPRWRARISGLPTGRVASGAAAPAEPRAAPARSAAIRPQPRPPKMPVDFTGYWKMLANENFEEYLRALGKPLPAQPGPLARGAPRALPRQALLPGARAKGGRRAGLRGGLRACPGGWGLLGFLRGKYLRVGSSLDVDNFTRNAGLGFLVFVLF